MGVIWGVTNPWLERGSSDSKMEGGFSIKSLLKILVNYKFLVPFLLNQLGSVLFNYFMGSAGTILLKKFRIARLFSRTYDCEQCGFYCDFCS